MATIRGWLEKCGFDWETGKIVFQAVQKDDDPGWADPIGSELIVAPFKHPILDYDFYAGYGGPQCPRFIAQDRYAIFFPSQYDGATGIVKVHKDISKYLNWKDFPTPYPGS